MQLIVTCAGCGAKYRGESSPKKFRCAACSNLFTFPDKPMAPSTGTILCSNCWTETVPTEKLKTCGFCSQRVSPRYGGLSVEDKQIKVKQASVRNDPNLVKAATNPNPGSSGEVSVSSHTQGNPPSGNMHFASAEWKEINAKPSGDRHELPQDPKKTQAFELLAELKKEIEPEMQGMVEYINKAQEASSIVDDGTLQHSAPKTSSSELVVSNSDAGIALDQQNMVGALEAQLSTERLDRQSAHEERDELQRIRAGLESKITALEQQLAQERSGHRDDALREMQAKIAELSSLVAADKRTKDQLMRERVELEELYRENEAKVAELQTRANSDAAARLSVIKERDELREFRREHEALHADLAARLDTEKNTRDGLQRERDSMAEKHNELQAKVAEMQSRIASERNVRDSQFRSREELEQTRNESEGRIADLETRLAAERRTKDMLIRDRDQLSDNQREMQARIADLETRLQSEREAKEAVIRKRDELLEAKGELEGRTADLESRLTLEREAKEQTSTERDKLLELRKELEARTADLTRRHATEREAREQAMKEHGTLQGEHRELSARSADLKARLKAEQDIKDSVRKERDEALARADSAEARAERSELEAARMRKGYGAMADKFAAEYNVVLSKLATKTSEFSTHAKLSRKRLEEEAAHHDRLESTAAELKAKLESESVEIGQRLKKLMQEGEANVRDSARFPVLTTPAGSGSQPAPTSPHASGSHALADGTHAGHSTATSPSASGSNRISGRLPSAVAHAHLVPSDSTAQTDGTPTPPPSAAGAPSSSSSSRNPAMSEATVGENKDDKTSGTFWAKVFKRPAAK